MAPTLLQPAAVPPSADPPHGLAPAQVPQLVSLGFDDNAHSGLAGSGGTGGVAWVTALLAERTNADRTPARASFFMATTHVETWTTESPTLLKRAWRAALADGHEIGIHTHSHPHGAAYSVGAWTAEIEACAAWLTKPFDPDEVACAPDDSKGIGLESSARAGFRAPYLEHNDALFTALRELGLAYDCSVEQGWQREQDGTSFCWPYADAGLWELPAHPVIVPPDELCAEYGVPRGLRARLKGVQGYFDEADGKITGFDYNLWVLFAMNKDEFLATLKHTLDLRLAGNRAPFLLGAHSDCYSSKYTAPNATVAERQQALADFVDYALSQPAVRLVPLRDVLAWVQNPAPLAGG